MFSCFNLGPITGSAMGEAFRADIGLLADLFHWVQGFCVQGFRVLGAGLVDLQGLSWVISPFTVTAIINGKYEL